MDPDTCYARIVQHLSNGEPTGAREAALDLCEWLRRGGFRPSAPDWRRTVDRAIRRRPVNSR